MDLGLDFIGPLPEPPHRQPRMHCVLPTSKAYIARLSERAASLRGRGSLWLRRAVSSHGGITRNRRGRHRWQRQAGAHSRRCDRACHGRLQREPRNGREVHFRRCREGDTGQSGQHRGRPSHGDCARRPHTQRSGRLACEPVSAAQAAFACAINAAAAPCGAADARRLRASARGDRPAVRHGIHHFDPATLAGHLRGGRHPRESRRPAASATRSATSRLPRQINQAEALSSFSTGASSSASRAGPISYRPLPAPATRMRRTTGVTGAICGTRAIPSTSSRAAWACREMRCALPCPRTTRPSRAVSAARSPRRPSARSGRSERGTGVHRRRSCNRPRPSRPGQAGQADSGTLRCGIRRPGRGAARRTRPPHRLGIHLGAHRGPECRRVRPRAR